MSSDARRGIVSYGAYLPYHRLDRTSIRSTLGQGGGAGRRPADHARGRSQARAPHASP